MTFYPLQFAPIFRRYLWGGRRLETRLHKSIGAGNNYAESWEIVDHGEDQSAVVNGPLAGRTLHDLMDDAAEALVGPAWCDRIRHPKVPPSVRGRFPLLLKFLDAQRALSVQVHPNDDQAAGLQPPDLGKTEAWYVLDCEADSRIYAGLQPGVDRPALEQAVAENALESLLHWFTPQPGDAVFIPAGTVHAIGAGVLICEIQQASDTTFRLFDWNRVDADGKARPLHIAQSLEVIDLQRGPVLPRRTQNIDGAATLLVECDKFVLWRRCIQRDWTVPNDGLMRIIVAISGGLRVEGDSFEPVVVSLGQCALLPAALPQSTCRALGRCEVLVIELPEIRSS